MDDFKSINDRFGHREGDAALKTAAQILRGTFRDSDVVARLGGDEFVVLAADTGSTQAIVDRLARSLDAHNTAATRRYRLSFSVGVARFDPAAPPSIEELLATADAMLYEQKRLR
jgi:diguanylate cyclase (GGDEF)-like protein